MTYRAPTTPVEHPLFVVQRPFLRALDPNTGMLLWEHRFADPDGVGRIFLQDARVLIAMGPQLHCFESATGRALGVITLGFTPDTGLVHDGKLFLGSNGALACVASDGRVLWSGQSSGGWDGGTFECRDQYGAVLWQGASPSTDARSAAGMAIAGIVVQPDKGKAAF